MAEIPTFNAKAPGYSPLTVSTDTGAVDLFATLAQTSGRLAAQLRKKAEDKANEQGAAEGLMAGTSVTMPGVDYAFGDQAAGDASAATRGMAGDIRAIVSQAAQRHGVDPGAMLRIAMIESSGNPKAKNPKSSAGGLFQFIDSTAAQYGLADRYDPAQAADAAARLAKDNAAHLRRVLRRDPTGAELYLAHQQGAGGAAKLLANPNAPAASIVGADAVALNGGHAGMTAGEFAGIWLKKAGGASSAAAGPSIRLTGGLGPLPQRPPGTPGAEAYNKVATEIYVNRATTAIAQQIDALEQQHADNPAALKSAIEALRAGYQADMPPAARAIIDQTFQTQGFSAMRAASKAATQRIEQENVAAADASIDAGVTAATRIATAGTDADADASLNTALGQIDSAIENSPLTPLQKNARRTQATRDVMEARILAGYDALPDGPARAAYVQSFDEEWQAGKGFAGKLDAAGYQAVRGALLTRAGKDEAAATRRVAAFDKAVGAQLDFIEKGYPVAPAAIDILKKEAALATDPAITDRVDFLEAMAGWQRQAIGLPVAALDAQIAAHRARIDKEGANPRAIEALDIMEGVRSQMGKALATDPLTFADRAGLLRVEPLDFSDGEKLTASLSERVADSAAVASRYGIAPRWFTPAETDALKKALAETPLALPSIASSLAAGLGRDAPRALAEISDDAPLLAHVGGLAALTGSQRATVEIAEALELRRQPGYKSALPSPAKLSAAAQTHFEGALPPDAMPGVLEAASALYERRALARGIDPEDVAKEGTARDLFTRSLEEVTGATWRDGVKFGGLASVNGRATIAPPDIAADEMEDLMLDLSRDDLIFQAPLGTANGVAIAPEQLRGGQLVRVGPDRYRVALGDIEAGDPKFVPGAEGGYWEIDISMLAKTRSRRSAWRGGSPTGWAR